MYAARNFKAISKGFCWLSIIFFVFCCMHLSGLKAQYLPFDWIHSYHHNNFLSLLSFWWVPGNYFFYLSASSLRWCHTSQIELFQINKKVSPYNFNCVNTMKITFNIRRKQRNKKLKISLRTITPQIIENALIPFACCGLFYVRRI